MPKIVKDSYVDSPLYNIKTGLHMLWMFNLKCDQKWKMWFKFNWKDAVPFPKYS